MIMKNILQSIILLFAATIIISCNLDLAPENTMVDEITYRDSSTAEAALLGAYSRFNASFEGAPTGSNNYANTGYFLLFSEIGTPTLAIRSNSSFVNMVNSEYNTSDHDGFILNIWSVLYNAIDYANSVITNIDKYGQYSESAMRRHIAEAKFLRAYEYLSLLEAFGDGALTGDMNGLGAILRLSPYDGYNPKDIQPRATVGDTYKQIIQDLKDAIPFLPDNNASTLAIRARASKTAAYALLSRIYLYRGSYKNDPADMKLVCDCADSVLNNTKGYAFTSSNTNHTSNMFPLNTTGAETNPASYSTEVIFLAPHYSSTNNYSNGVGSSFFNKTAVYIDNDFISTYITDDRRGYIDPATGTVSLIWSGSTTSYADDKTTYKFNNGSGYNNILYLRVSEIMLNKAEAYARMNGINDISIGYLNDIRRRPFATASKPAALIAANFSSANELIDAILSERMKELAYEGYTRWDLIRTGRPLRDATVSNDKKILPIPNYDINISYGAIVQNKGYR
jgi:starch-binding outer membrane protein, SusD/RagB family